MYYEDRWTIIGCYLTKKSRSLFFEKLIFFSSTYFHKKLKIRYIHTLKEDIMVTTRSQQLQMTTRSKANSQTVFVELKTKSQERGITRPHTRSQAQTQKKEIESKEKQVKPFVVTYESEDSDSYIDNEDNDSVYEESIDEDEDEDESIDEESIDDDETIGHTTTTSEVVFDPDYFDDAHDEWMKNKRKLDNGCYVYICGYVYANRKLCQRDCCDKIGLYSGCKKHYMWEEKIHKLLMIPEV